MASVRKIVSGGQTGADRAALDVALACGLELGGWVPRGRRAEDGTIPAGYPNLVETDSEEPAERTELNVRDSDATLALSHGALRGGSALTFEAARRHGRPALHVDLSRTPGPAAARRVRAWLAAERPGTLNVAGSRHSEDPEIYEAAKRLLTNVLDPAHDECPS